MYKRQASILPSVPLNSLCLVKVRLIFLRVIFAAALRSSESFTLSKVGLQLIQDCIQCRSNCDVDDDDDDDDGGGDGDDEGGDGDVLSSISFLFPLPCVMIIPVRDLEICSASIIAALKSVGEDGVVMASVSDG